MCYNRLNFQKCMTCQSINLRYLQGSVRQPYKPPTYSETKITDNPLDATGIPQIRHEYSQTTSDN